LKKLTIVAAGIFCMICLIGGHGFAVSRSYLKERILVQGQGGRYIKTGGILQYFEDSASGLHFVLNLAANAEIGSKDFFNKYSRSKFAKETGWDKLIRTYHEHQPDQKLD